MPGAGDLGAPAPDVFYKDLLIREERFQTVVQGFHPWRMMRWGHRAGERGGETVMTIGQDVFFLVVLPFLELLSHDFRFEVRVICTVKQVADIGALEVNIVSRAAGGFLLLTPRSRAFLLLSSNAI